MNSLGLNIPEMAKLKPNEKHAFSISPKVSDHPTDSEIAAYEKRIGSSINSNYAKELRTRRLEAVTAAAVSTILTVGAIIAAVMVATNPLSIAGFIILSIFSASFSVTFPIIHLNAPKDLNSPQRRGEVMQNIAMRSLEDVANPHALDQYGSKDLVGYALLDRTFAVGPSDPKKRAVAYARFEQLSSELNRAKLRASISREQAKATHEAAKGAFIAWYNYEMKTIYQARRLNQDDKAHQQREWDLLRCNNKTHARWDCWLKIEENAIDVAYNIAACELQCKFLALKS